MRFSSFYVIKQGKETPSPRKSWWCSTAGLTTLQQVVTYSWCSARPPADQKHPAPFSRLFCNYWGRTVPFWKPSGPTNRLGPLPDDKKQQVVSSGNQNREHPLTDHTSYHLPGLLPLLRTSRGKRNSTKKGEIKNPELLLRFSQAGNKAGSETSKEKA